MLLFIFLTLTQCLNVIMYMESLCPDTTHFIKISLSTLAVPDVEKLLNLTMIPFGKAQHDFRNRFHIQCQHGATECYGNTLQSCGLAYLDSLLDQVKFITCMQSETYSNEEQMNIVLSRCLPEIHQQILACIYGPEGIELQYRNALRTPQVPVVPSFAVDGYYLVESKELHLNMLKWACHLHPVIAACDQFK